MTNKRSFSLLFIIVATLFLLSCTPQRNFVEEWAEFQYNSSRTAHLPDGPKPPLSLYWTFKTGGRILYSPVIKDKAIFFGSRDGFLYSLSVEDGGVLWKSKLVGKQGRFGAIGRGGPFQSPSIVGDFIYAGKWSPYYYVFGWDRLSGKQLWKYYTGELLNRSPWLSADKKHLYFNSDPSLKPGVREDKPSVTFNALNHQTKKIVWDQPLPGLIKASTASTDDLIFVPVTGEPSWLYALNKNNGSIKWKYKLSGQLKSSPLIRGNIVYIASSRGHLYAFDVQKGKLLWRYPFPNSSIIQNLSLGDNRLFISDSKNTMYAFDLTNLEIIWKYRSYKPFGTSIATNDFVYMGGPDRNFTVLDAKNGSFRWSYRTKGEIIGSPIIYKDFVFIGSTDGTLYAFKELESKKK